MKIVLDEAKYKEGSCILCGKTGGFDIQYKSFEGIMNVRANLNKEYGYCSSKCSNSAVYYFLWMVNKYRLQIKDSEYTKNMVIESPQKNCKWRK